MQQAVILAIDTALDACSAALAIMPDGACHAKTEIMGRGHSERLVPLCGEVIADGGLTYADLTHIAVTIGPGAFTGLRIGMATAKVLGLTLGIPVIGVTTLQAIAYKFAQTSDMAFTVILETKRDDFYVQNFGAGGSAISPPVAMDGDTLAQSLVPDAIIVGDGAQRYMRMAEKNFIYMHDHKIPDPVIVARLGYATLVANNVVAITPLYLRNADVSSTKKNQRIIIDA